MTIQIRTCSNCCSYEPTYTGEAPMCQNAVSLVLNLGTPQETRQAVGPTDVCHDHATVEEDAQVDEVRAKVKDLSPECKQVIHEWGLVAEANGPDHPDALAAWQAAAALDPSGYLADVEKQRLAEVRTAHQIANSSPEFLEAMSACLRLNETLGMEHEESKKALMLAMHLAPESLHEEMGDMAREMGLMPDKPDGYTEDGEPIYSLESIAKTMGISMNEAEAELHKMLAATAELGIPSSLIDPATVHPMH